MRTRALVLICCFAFTALITGAAFVNPATADDGLFKEADDLLQRYANMAPPAGAPPMEIQAGPASQFASSPTPVVRCMPGSQTTSGQVNPYAWVNRSLVVWGRVDGGVAPYTYQWDFGDGSPPASGAVSSTEYIAVYHTYTVAAPYFATLTVTDNNGNVDSRAVDIRVVNFLDAAHEQDIRTNAAIQDGLRWLYRHQSSNGSWENKPQTTAPAVAAFELREYWPDNDPLTDVYAEFVHAGLEYICSVLCTYSIGVQPHGNPDSNGNGFGLYSCLGVSQANSAYTQGLMMYAIALSRTPDAVATHGGAGIVGRTYRDILTDMADQLAYSQCDAGSGRGGWRYSVNTSNYGTSDNSAVQWASIGLQAAEEPNNLFNIPVPQFVKDELTIWVGASSCGGGGWSYTDPGYGWCNLAKAGSGLFSLLYTDGYQAGDPPSARTQAALTFLGSHWCDNHDDHNYVEAFNGNFYALYAMKKALDDWTLTPDGHPDWYGEMVRHLVKTYTTPCQSNSYHQVTDTGDMNNDGRWPNTYWVSRSEGGTTMSTSFAELILIPGITSCRIYCDTWVAEPDSAQPNTEVCFDATPTYTNCPDRYIASWEWDFDASDGVSFSPPDASGEYVCNPAGYPLPQGEESATYTVTLRVTDSEGDVCQSPMDIVVSVDNHKPVACLNGPFTACVGDTIFLDACCSFDPDVALNDSIVAYYWDLAGTGNYDYVSDTCRPDTFFVFTTETVRDIGLRVVDTFGRVSDAAATLIWSSFQDLSVSADEISIDRIAPPCDTLRITAVVRAAVQGGAPDITDAVVRMYHDVVNPGNVICETHTGPMGNGDSVVLQCLWSSPDDLEHEIIVFADPGGAIRECRETDNRASVTIRCDNTPPVAECFFAITVPADSACYGYASVDSSSFDPDGNLIILSQEPPGPYPVGTTLVMLVVEDSFNETDTCYCYVIVEDVTAPSLEVTLNRDVLWPPNHKMVDIFATITASDNCTDVSGAWTLVSVTSNEPDDAQGGGDGSTTDDIQIGPNGDTLKLRAERLGSGDGRVYTLIYSVSDSTGNTTLDTLYVYVPHDQGGNALMVAGAEPLSTLLAAGTGSYALVIPWSGNLDPASVDPARAYVGNQAGVVRPTSSGLRDVTGDGERDLVLVYPVAETRDVWLQDGQPTMCGLHYTSADGRNFLAKDIFSLESIVSDVGDLDTLPPDPQDGEHGGTTPLEDGIGDAREVVIEVYTVTGRRIRTFVTNRIPDDSVHPAWDGKDESGRPAANGIYFYRIKTSSKVLVKKIMLVR